MPGDMVLEGATFIDVGGESTRPALLQYPCRRSWTGSARSWRPSPRVGYRDLSRYQHARGYGETTRLGAGLINDVRALQREGAVAAAVASRGPGMSDAHAGPPEDMQAQPQYKSVLRDVIGFLMDRVRVLEEAGLVHDRVLLDPGFGFGKTLEHNLDLLRSLAQIAGAWLSAVGGPVPQEYAWGR